MASKVISEKDLVSALEPFKGFVLANVLFMLQQSGVQELLEKGVTESELCEQRSLDPARVRAFVDYLLAADLVTRSTEGVLVLTPTALAYNEARAWYEMMVGGYGQTFRALGDHLAAGSSPAPRAGGFVGSGSCGISLHDAIPLLRRLLEQGGRKYSRLVDLGCGSGVYLTELCRDYPAMTAVGLEPDAQGAAAARAWVAQQEAGDRVTIAETAALDWLGGVSEIPDLAVLAFVIHEVLGQEGEDGVRKLLYSLFEAAPDLDLAIIDIDLHSADLTAMGHPLAQNYYNAYFLMHPFTSQKLETREWWEALFNECGLSVKAFGTTDPSMDSTGFEVGWLLRRDPR